MNKTTRLKHYALRLTPYASRLNLDTLLGLFLFAAGLYAYTITLAPTVLEGDKALFQYTPYVLGVTYPTGFPLYILLGKLWLTLFPFGEIAWRMNFLSALCSAAALPLLYNALRRLLSYPPQREEDLGTSPPLGGIEGGRRWAALVAVLTFATLPTFWHWSTVAKTYPLNTLLLAGILYLFSVTIEKHPSPSKKSTTQTSSLRLRSGQALIPHPSSLIFLLLGLQISVHNTAILLIPGLLLFAWLNFRQYLLNKKLLPVHVLLLILPGLFYLYIPLRAQGLIAQYGRDEAIQRGLLADFYQPGLAGLVDYFLAAKFTGGIVTNWGLIPEKFISDYVPLLTSNFHLLGIALGVIGGLALAILRPRIFWPLFLIYLVPIPFVLTYDRGEQSAFLIPSFLVFSIFVGSIFILVDRLSASRTPALGKAEGTHHASRPRSNLQGWARSDRRTHYASRLTFFISSFIPSAALRAGLHPSSFILLLLLLFLPQIRYNYNWLGAKWNRAIYDERADALSHPLEPGATMLAHWGDLTPFWYMQHTENRRPDLHGLYPPDEEIVTDWFAKGGQNLYIAGPLQGWASDIQKRYQLIPWGRLVRIAPHDLAPEALLPALPHPVEVTFNPQNTDNHKLRLISVDYPPQAMAGSEYAVTLAWQALTDLSPETTISPRLSQGEAIVAQLDDSLLSAWFPSDTLPVGQHVLSYVPIPIPLGTLPGQYRLQLVVYTDHTQPWTTGQGATLLDLGEVEIVSPPANYRPASTTATLPHHDFNGELELIDYDYSVRRVGQGKGFAVEFLWRALKQPVDNYTLLAEVVDARGNILRTVEHQPAGGLAPTATWQPGQFIRDQVDLVVPASAPVGQNTLRVRLSWLRPNGTSLNIRRWFLPMGDTLDLEWVSVTEKKGRIFETPSVQYPVEANFENKARLIGYNVSPSPSPLTPRYEGQISQKDCLADPPACHLHFDFYWQGLAEMEQSYAVFLHVVDAQGQIVTQHDLELGEHRKQPTTGWLPGEVVTHPVDLHLPADIAPGQYGLYLGMYLPPDGPRLLVLDEEGQAVADFVEVGTIRVRP
jgi:hypothetical protein